MSKLDSAITALNKKYGDGTIVKGNEARGLSIQRIPSGSLAFDIESGGGWIRGKWNEIFGPPSSGKTFLCLVTIANAQKLYPEHMFVWIDFEGAFDPVWAVKIGVDLSRLIVTSPEYMEEGFDIAGEVIKTDEVPLLVIDSWAAACPKDEYEKDIENFTPGLRARRGNQFIRKSKTKTNLFEELSTGKTTLLVINQTYSTFTQYGNPEETPGGAQLKFGSMLRVRIKRQEKLEDKNGELLAQQSQFTIVKNKTFPPNRKGSFWFSIRDNKQIGDAGKIWRLGELLDYGVATGVIKQAGAWFQLPEVFGGEKFHGKDGVAEWVRGASQEDVDRLEHLVADEVFRKIGPLEE